LELLLFVAASQNCVYIGQFARLLPALAVVAISQAPSPESNPDSLSPVRATVVHYTTVQADRSEVHVIKQDLLWTCHAESPGLVSHWDQPDSALDSLPLPGAGLSLGWLQSTTVSRTESLAPTLLWQTVSCVY